MRYRVLVIVAAVCVAAACSNSAGKKPVAAPTSSLSTTAAAQAATTASSPSASTDVNVGVMCSNLDAQTKDLADLVGKLANAQSVPAMGIGLPIEGGADAARKLVLEHPGSQIDPDLTAFAASLDAFDTAVTSSTPDSSITQLGDVESAWKTLSRDCGLIGGYAFSNRLG